MKTMSDLPNDRIDAIRARVMYQVDADITRRGRRVRRAVAGGIGVLALITVLGVSVPSLTGGPSGPDGPTAVTADGDGSAAMPEPDVAARDDAAGSGYDAQQLDAKALPEGEISPVPPDPQPPLTAPGKDREVITTGSAHVIVDDTAKAANRFTAWVEGRGGRVDARSESRDDEGHTSAHLMARIPSKHVTAAIGQLRTQGEVKSVDLQRDDVTAQGADLDGRIKALRISIERLENILERAGSSSEVIEAETALSQRQQELESLLLQRRSLTDQVALSTLSVSFEQESKPGSVAPGGFRGGLIAGWNALLDTVEAIVTAAGAAVPWLGIAGAVALLWWGVRRARRRG
ncbi:MAG TPA: DUF4349 domain-containing protein [Aeromicrobium sp.]|nr:DUF4349 domain-containing protein [Aeromicrobium sp.]